MSKILKLELRGSYESDEDILREIAMSKTKNAPEFLKKTCLSTLEGLKKCLDKSFFTSDIKTNKGKVRQAVFDLGKKFEIKDVCYMGNDGFRMGQYDDFATLTLSFTFVMVVKL